MSGTEGRAAVSFWRRAERERQLLQAVKGAERQRHMLRAGGIGPDTLPERGRRILVWLTEWDEGTVEGVRELRGAGHHAGRQAAEPAPRARPQVEDTTPTDRVKARLAALEERRPGPDVGL